MTVTLTTLLVLSAIAGCDDDPDPLPGLVILTPVVGAPADGEAAILLRSNLPARVSVHSEGVLLGAGRSSRDVSALRFATPSWTSSGSVDNVTVIAVAEGGGSESVEATIVGLGVIETTDVEIELTDIAAVDGDAILKAPSQVWLTNRSSLDLIGTSVTGPIQAIAADPSTGSFLVADANASISAYQVDGDNLSQVSGQSFSFAPYDGLTSPPVSTVLDLHVNDNLVAAGTAAGMAIVDRSVHEPEPFCRRRSTMTASLSSSSFDHAMRAVIVTADERVIAGGAYLNINEANAEPDDGGCTPPMNNRGTVVVNPLGENTQAWEVTAIILTSSSIWIGRQHGGIIKLPVGFELVQNRYLNEDVLVQIPGSELPLPLIVDLAPARSDMIWAALTNEEAIIGGLARIGPEGVELWIDASSLAGVPRAIATEADTNTLWTVSDTSVAVFTDQ